MAVPLPASRKPELKPFTVMFVSCAGMQGVANSDWIAEWLPWVTVSEEREWLVSEWMRDGGGEEETRGTGSAVVVSALTGKAAP